MQLRDYQTAAVDSVWQHLRTRSDNPVVVLPPGCGKSVVIAELCRQAVSQWNGRVLILTHVRELVLQNAGKIRQMLPSASVGVHSASLNKRDLDHPVICAGIQSVYKKACDLGRFDLVAIDECFTAGTLISTPRGDVPIERLRVGQTVHTALGIGEVEAISARPAERLLEVEVDDGTFLRCTPNHPFLTDRGWVPAGELETGARLFRQEDMRVLREGDSGGGPGEGAFAGCPRVARVAPVEPDGPAAVFNLQVSGHPSYYAGGILVHNCHLIPPDGEGMYRAFLNDAKIINPRVRLVGLTATPFRLASGDICSESGLLNTVAYEAGVREMIEAGWLSPLVSKVGMRNADVTGLHIRGGEFIAGEAEELMDADELVRSAVREIVEATADRKSCLIFCSGVKHGEHVARVFHEEHGIECGFVEGGTPSGERARLIARFRGDEVAGGLFKAPPAPLKYLANVGVLTTGFDHPGTDCIALLRPTASAGLFSQMVGRGLRLAPDKKDCLILDFAGNLVRHGPVDLLKAGDRPKKGVPGEAPAKSCENCRRVVHASATVCPECGFEFPKNDKPKHDAHASTAPVVSEERDDTPLDLEVLETVYMIHAKKNAPPGHPPSMRVCYRVGGYTDFFNEWICPQHTGYAREKFVEWWKRRSRFPPPRTVADAVRLAREGALAPTLGIRVKTDDSGFDKVVAWSLADIPDPDSDILVGEREAAGEPVAVPASGGWDDFDDADIPF